MLRLVAISIGLAAAATPAAACPDLAAALGLHDGDAVDSERCAGRFAVAQVTRSGAYEQDIVALADDGTIAARDVQTDLPAAYHDLANPIAIAAAGDTLVFSAQYEHWGDVTRSLLVYRVDGANLTLVRELPLGRDNTAADVPAAEMVTCSATWRVRGHAIVVRGRIGRHGRDADLSGCPARGTRRRAIE